MVSNRDNSGKHSGVHSGMVLGHGTGMDLAWIWGMIHGLDSSQSCMDFGGIVRGGILARFLGNDWHDFDVIFGVILGKILG